MISSKDKIMIFVLMVSGFAGSLSQNLLTSALPSIIEDTGVDALTGQWLTTSYILVLGVITAISAWIFFRVNTRRLEQLSLGLFLIGCVIALAAPNFHVLLFARIIQACGAGILIPLLQIVVLYIYPPEKQGQAMSLTGIIVGFAPAIGPTLSGILTDAFGWRSIFTLLIIISAAMLVIGHFTIRDVTELKPEPLDVTGVILYTLGFVTFMLGVNDLKTKGITSFLTIVMFAVGVICLFAFTYMQLHKDVPLLKLELLRDRALSSGTIMLSTAYVLMMAGTILVPLYIQTICGYSATVSGLILLPGSLLIALLSPVSGRMTDRYGARRVCILGMLILAAGCLGFTFCNEAAAVVMIVICYTFRSIGLAFLITPCSTLAVQEMPADDKPHATAILNSVRQMCGALFSAVLVMISTAASRHGSLDMNGMHISFIWMLVIAVAGVLLAVFAAPKHVKVQ